MLSLFSTLDEDGSGDVDVNEFLKGLKLLGVMLSPAEEKGASLK